MLSRAGLRGLDDVARRAPWRDEIKLALAHGCGEFLLMIRVVLCILAWLHFGASLLFGVYMAHANNDNIVHECYSLSDAHVTRKVKEALEQSARSYEFCESFGFAAALDFKEVKDRLREGLGAMEARVHAVDEGEMLIEAEGIFAELRFSQKPKYCAARIKVWAHDKSTGKKFEEATRAIFNGHMVSGIMFGLHWAYMGGRGLDDVYIEEVFEDGLLEQAYPCLAPHGGINAFIDAYLDSDETVLILQGTAGAGKTRLVRKILSEISRRAIERGGDEYGSKATALYTGDQKAMESDEIFARFITGEERAFVVEDADHMLRPRSDGNDNLHRFLAVADGVVRAAGRKIIFSTNLPNINDIDEALARPGRCFARLRFHDLDLPQAKLLAEAIGVEITDKIDASSKRSLSVAEVYSMAGKAKAI
jgi:molybdopterin-guanine dinucleotide biosynthesis protein